MKTLAGKVALVTGASRGIGRACALALAESGADVAVNFRAHEEAARETCSLVESQGRRALPVRTDVSKPAEVDRMVDLIARELGTVEILVNNAGIVRRYPWDRIPEEAWDEIFAVNLKSANLVTQAVLPGMRTRRWGRIVTGFPLRYGDCDGTLVVVGWPGNWRCSGSARSNAGTASGRNDRFPKPLTASVQGCGARAPHPCKRCRKKPPLIPVNVYSLTSSMGNLPPGNMKGNTLAPDRQVLNHIHPHAVDSSCMDTATTGTNGVATAESGQ